MLSPRLPFLLSYHASATLPRCNLVIHYHSTRRLPHTHLSPSPAQAVSPAWLQAALRSPTLDQINTLEADCAEWCSALTLVTPELPLLVWNDGFGRNLNLFFEASPAVWSKVQCMSNVDADSDDRACCSPSFCRDSCPTWGDGREASDACKVVAAGCSMNRHDLVDPKFHSTYCSWDDMDWCVGCKQGYWCTDHGIFWGDDWVGRFYGDRDWTGDVTMDYRQCRWKPSERAQFIDASKSLYAERDFFWGGDWNEVRRHG